MRSLEQKHVRVDPNQLNSFPLSIQTLRPVTISDFEAAIEFWDGNRGLQNGDAAERDSGDFVQHYDSSSDSEDEAAMLKTRRMRLLVEVVPKNCMMTNVVFVCCDMFLLLTDFVAR